MINHHVTAFGPTLFCLPLLATWNDRNSTVGRRIEETCSLSQPPAVSMLNTLAADRALVADLDAKIQDLERTLSALRSKKLLAEERLDAYKYGGPDAHLFGRKTFR
jgi:hypothetical protein